MKGVSIWIKDGMAFVPYDNDTMLCIGTKKEIDEATPQQVFEMIRYAVIYSKYQLLEHSKHSVN